MTTMKFNVILCLCLSYISQLALAQPCNSFNVSLINQVDVEGFLTQNGNCTEISGDLVIGNNVENLDGLENIKKISGYFSMSNCDALTDIKGLKNLTEVGSWMRMQHNPMLQSYEGLNSLQKVKGDFFYISDSDRIKDLTPLSNLDSINGIFQIWDMDSLKNFSGLNGLKHVGADLSIFKNKHLHSFTGLDSLSSVNGALRIYENDDLTNLLDLNSDLNVTGQIVIYDNPMLSSCHAAIVCDYIQNNPNNIIISNNLSGCDNTDEILVQCISGIGDDVKTNYNVYPNPVSDVLAIDGLINATKVNIYSMKGELILTTYTDKNIDLISLPSGNYTIAFLNNKISIIKL